ncbi:tripartite tricarboxylate transporter substrate binding protein [Polaromonas sp. SM01]|uniref:Bug family tripartite tricarboxylate transporter substrate binding protein n=1 Tax=Polaromonas sp. SM01 TaxID=3085630 RepID=UPI00298100CC|nr:tripartite tricarboxylate transporter substrate binding protein [Polaromonas sp. SM01]MDW5444513.1 tripartite tricarboxylate transporter substrate binding protein [Polaromonas sp. SM01]
MRTRYFLKCALAAAAVLTLAPVMAQGYPSRPIKLVVPFAAGGSTDAIARLVGQKMGDALGQSVVIDNRPGAAGAIASEQVARAPADGYTLLMATTSTHAILSVANPKLPYDAVKDFAPVGLVARAPNVLVVSNTLGVTDVKGLLQLAKAKRGQLSFASSGNGTITHLVGELFKSSSGTQAVHVPYKTGVQALADVVSGQVGFQFDSITWTLPQARAGKIKALAVTGLKRSPLAPELPTVAESGLPGFEGVTWFGFVAPAATPPEVLARLATELGRALQSQDVQDKLAAQGAEAASGRPDDLARLMREDAVKWGRVIRDAGVKFE